MAILLAVLMLMGAACSITDETTINAPAPDDSTAPTGSAPAPVDGGAAAPGDTNPATESTAPVVASDKDSADGQESAEPAPFIYKYPEFMLTNPQRSLDAAREALLGAPRVYDTRISED